MKTTLRTSCILLCVFFALLFIQPSFYAQNATKTNGWEKEIFEDFDPQQEIIEKRDLFTKHFLQTNGKVNAFIGAGPIHYQEAGAFKTILHAIHQNNTHFYNFTNSFKSKYPLTADQPIETELQANAILKDLIGLKMYFLQGTIQTNGIHAKNIAGTVDFNTITYANALGNGIDVIIEQQSTKRKIDFKINTLSALGTIPSHADYLVFEEKVEVPNNWKLILKENVIDILNERNEKVAQYDQPYFHETQEHDHATHEKSNHTGTTIGNYLLSFENGQYTIKTLVPMSWILQKGLHFPIYIDPTVNCSPTNVANWTGYHKTSSSTNSHLATSATYTSTTIAESNDDIIMVGRENGTAVYNGWAKFDITAVPDDACINSVRVYYNVYTNNTTDNACRVNCNVTHMHTDPILHTTNVNRLADIRDGDIYQTRDFAIHGSGTGWYNFLLTNNLNHFSTQLPLNWFSIGFHNYSGANNHNTCRNYIRGRSQANKPYIVVDYSYTTPTFTQIAPICNGGTFTLPTTSTNSITGTWSPAINNTATTTYTFTPATGQCLTTTTMTVTVNPSTAPTFTQVAPICSGGTFTLPTTSTNNITGTWSPAINNTTTTTYTFTPAAGQCGATTTMTVAVNSSITPTFTQVAPICSGGTFTLPTTSTNSITGTWSPAINNTTTTTYTFTPAAGQCGATTTMEVIVTTSITPTFTQVAPICSGGTFTLPTTATNNITGTWSPAINNTTTTTYTFTPAAGQCAGNTTMTVQVIPQPIVTATKTDITCFNQNNGSATITVTNTSNPITYTWNPAVSTNATATNLAGGTYTVTASTGNGCSGTTTVTIINPTALQLSISNVLIGCTPNTSSATANPTGGTAPYTYAWSPSGGTNAIANQLSGGVYNVTVTDAKGCTTTESVTIGNAQPIQVSLISQQPSCLSNDGQIEAMINGGNAPYTYNWNPAVSTSSIAANLTEGTYTVNVQDANGCTGQATETLILNGSIDVQITANPPSIVEGQSSNLFANVNANYGAVTYTWTPSNQLSCANCPNPIVNTTTYGTLTYVVTVESANGCIGKDTIQLIVLQKCGEIFIPTTFSPNGDGVNDEFKPSGVCIEKVNVKIYNRWGEKVFESNDPLKGWDGTFKNQQQNSGAFAYVISVTTRDSLITTYKGNVALVR